MDHVEKRREDYRRLQEQVKAIDTVKSKRPLINENAATSFFSTLSDPMGGLSQTSNSPVDYKQLWEVWTQTPECIAPCDTIVTDIIADGYTIRPIKAGDNTAVKKATEFLESNQFKTRVLPSQLYDQLVTGDAYVYKQKLTESRLGEAVKAIARRLPLKSDGGRDYLYYAVRDEDTLKTKDLINIASSTIKIHHDEHGNVLKYAQKVGQKDADFTTKEIIHFKYMNLNGKMYSYCPMKAILPEAMLIGLIKNHAAKMFDQGGRPASMYVLEEETPKSENTQFLIEQLKQFKTGENIGRDLVVTGVVDRKPFEDISKDMAYRDLLEQLTRIIYTEWGVPPSKMGQPGQDSGAYDSGLATEGYYRRIAHLQDQIYSQYNAQLMIPEFKVEIVPNKAYLQDELKESQMQKQKMDIAQQAFNNNYWNEEAVIDYLQIDERHQGTFEKMDMMSNFRQGDMKKGDVEGKTPKQEINKMKSDTQKQKSPQLKALIDKGYTKREAEAIIENDRPD